MPREPAGTTGQPVPPAERTGADAPAASAARDLRRGAIVVASLAVAGAPLGALWAVVAPRPDPAAVVAGTDSALTAQMGADVAFLLITGVAGAVAGVLVWRFVREASWLVPLALAVGGGAGALVAAAVGAAVNSAAPGLAGLAEQSGATLSRLEDLLAFGVRAKSALLALPLAALVVFAALTYVAGERTGRRARPAGPSAPAQQDPEAARAR